MSGRSIGQAFMVHRCYVVAGMPQSHVDYSSVVSVQSKFGSQSNLRSVSINNRDLAIAPSAISHLYRLKNMRSS
ncbi:hypothetical protein NXC24_PC01653 (plasmid) [Rhizobium sp. NXC24]|nr:hypothetical protein NXC24_PC01653 [Rhizobium sp. NXC24]